MATINDRETIIRIIENGGVYPGDEDSFLGPVVRIVRYTNIADQRVWGILYASEAEQRLWDKYMVTSEYLRNPEEIWRHPDVIVRSHGYATIANRLS